SERRESIAEGTGGVFGPALAPLPGVGAPISGAPRPAEGNGVRPTSAAGAAAGGGCAAGAGDTARCAGRSSTAVGLPVGRLPNTYATPTHFYVCRPNSLSSSGASMP